MQDSRKSAGLEKLGSAEAPVQMSPGRSQASSEPTLPPYIPQLNPGELIDGRFAVIRFIARGGMGEVYEVEDRTLRDVHVALKTIVPQYSADPLMRQRLKREVLSARQVVHPNVCPIYDLGQWNRDGYEISYLTMKLVRGESLSSRLVRAGSLGSDEALSITRQIGAGLAAAHRAGILHRDIKAANVMLDGSGPTVHVYVMDFGLARPEVSDETALTIHGIAGTPGFIAPELFFGASPSTGSDIYALGVLAHQILTEELPALASSDKNTVAVHISAQVPEPWRPFVDGCLKPTPAERFKTVEDALTWLPAHSRNAESTARERSYFSRRDMLVLGAGAVTVSAAGVAWLEWPRLFALIDPLPEKRFVALVPVPADHPPAILSTVLDSISQRLARAERFSQKHLLVITLRDLPGSSQHFDLQDAGGMLGANLLLATSLAQTNSLARLDMRLTDLASRRVIRRASVECAQNRISTLAEKAAQRAAELLQVPATNAPLSDPEELKSVPPQVFEEYSVAEQLFKQPNFAGLQQAIDQYQHVLELDRRFALAYARVSLAYMRQFLLKKDPASLDLATRNAASALRYNPHSATALLSQAMVSVFHGNAKEALVFFDQATQADPGNPDILACKMWVYQNNGQLDEAEKACRSILEERPNYWPAFNNLGVILARQARYEDAAKAFSAAGVAAPKFAQPMANLAQTYLQLGRNEDARRALNESLARSESDDGYLALGDLDFQDGKYREALTDYQNAEKLNPRNHLIERNIADCYFMLGDQQKVKEYYGRAAQLLSAVLAVNPADGFGWSNLAFYHAKVGDRAEAEDDMNNAAAHSATDVASRFMIVQALDVLGRKEEALNLLLWCLDKGLSQADVDLAVDLKDLRNTAAYQSKLKSRKDSGKTSAS